MGGRNIHPTQIVAGYMKALEDGVKMLQEIAIPIDLKNPDAMRDVVRGAIDTKFSSRWGNLISDLAIKAAETVHTVHPDGRKEIDLKRYAKVEKIPGGDLSDCQVLEGVI